MLNCKAHYVDHGCHLRTVGGVYFNVIGKENHRKI